MFSRFNHMFWVNASSQDTIKQDFQQIARDAELEHGTIVTVVGWLANQKLPWLLVLDNAHFSLDVGHYFPRQGCGSVLMTAQWKSEETTMAKEVKGFSQVQGLEFMKRITGRHEIKLSERAVVLDLIEKLDRIPLAIGIAGMYIQKRKISFQTYLDSDIWENSVLKYKKNKDSTGHSDSLAVAFKTTFEHISKALLDSDNSDGWADAIELLKFFSFLHPEGASEQILKHAWDFLCRDRDPDIVEARSAAAYSTKAWLEVLKPRISMTNWEPVFLRIRDALSLLSDWSLLEFDGDHRVYVHSLVQAWTIREIDERDRHLWFQKMAVILASNGADNPPEYVELASHLNHLLEVLPSMSVVDVPWTFEKEDFKLASIWADIYKESAYYSEARALRQAVCDRLGLTQKGFRFQRGTNPRQLVQHRLYLYTLKDLGGSCHDTGDHDSALEHLEEAIIEVKKLINPRRLDPALHVMLIGLQSDRAGELQCLGDHMAAYHQREETWKSLSEHSKDPRLLKAAVGAFRDLASSLIDIGRYSEAIAKLQQTISICERERQRFSPTDRDVLLARKELARAYMEDQQHEEAWKEYKALHNLMMESYKDHLHTLIAAEGVAASLSNIGKSKTALEIRVANVAHWKALPSQKNQQFPDFIVAKYNLAQNLEEVGDYSTALDHYNDVLKSRLALLRHKHGKCCKCKASLNDPAPQQPFNLAVLQCQTTYRFSTYEVMISFEALTTIWDKIGNAEQTNRFRRATMQVCELKADVPVSGIKTHIVNRSRREAYACLNRLASLAKRGDERISQRKKVLGLQRQYLGDDDCDTLITMIDLGLDYSASQDLASAMQQAQAVLKYKARFKGAYPNLFVSAEKLWTDVLKLQRIEQTAHHPQSPGRSLMPMGFGGLSINSAPQTYGEIQPILQDFTLLGDSARCRTY
ncbi:MAG: hypothetical protein Q9193_002577 [Seirophora villosa]